jgi:hypothetical protein
MLLGSAAFADYFEADPDVVNLTNLASSATVKITLVNEADQTPGCNVGNENDALTVTANVASANTTVATVTPSSLVFDVCDESQDIDISAAVPGCNGSTTVSVTAPSGWKARGGKNATFSAESIAVNVTGYENACGGNGPVTTCSEPAAPAWAAHILKANGKSASWKQGRETFNAVSNVAHEMGPGTDFQGVSKSNQEAYGQAVLDYLNDEGSKYTGMSLPGDWPPEDCVTE